VLDQYLDLWRGGRLRTTRWARRFDDTGLRVAQQGGRVVGGSQ